MRVIAGTLRGRRLDPPTWTGLRPTSDGLRETLFNILAPVIGGARVVDGYAGTGAVGIEALSRGADHVTFVDGDRRATDLLARNLARCGISDGFAILCADLGRIGARLPHAAFNLVFLDPPYETDPAEAMATAAAWLAPDGRLVVEHARRRAMPEGLGTLARVRQVRAGDSVLSFYAGKPAAPQSGDHP